jgi:hypothetical protein
MVGKRKNGSKRYAQGNLKKEEKAFGFGDGRPFSNGYSVFLGTKQKTKSLDF